MMGLALVVEAAAQGTPAPEIFQGALFAFLAGLFAWWMWGSRAPPLRVAAWGGGITAATVAAGAGTGPQSALAGALDPLFLTALGLWWADEPRRWLWGTCTLVAIGLALVAA